MPLKHGEKAARSTTGGTQQRPVRTNAATLIVVCAAGVLMLVAVRRPSMPVTNAKVYVESATHAELVEPAKAPVQASALVPLRAFVTVELATRAVIVEPEPEDDVPERGLRTRSAQGR